MDGGLDGQIDGQSRLLLNSLVRGITKEKMNDRYILILIDILVSVRTYGLTDMSLEILF